jgi:hypothetical protein
MKRLIFQGHSDDTFACDGPGIDVDYDTCGSGKAVWMRVASGNEALLVFGRYGCGPAAGWLIGVAPIEGPGMEPQHVPPWPMSITPWRCEYSPTLIIEAPDDVAVDLVPRAAA